MSEHENHDEFWNVAMMTPDYNDFMALNIRDDDDDDDLDDLLQRQAQLVTYKLSYCTSDNPHDPIVIALQLASMPEEDGVWSPVGANAWYASALLSAFILQNNHRDLSNNWNDPKDWFLMQLQTKKKSIVALELGSGAVGLSGFAMLPFVSKLILTDYDAHLLQILQANVDRNLSQLKHYNGVCTDILVESLDWRDYLANTTTKLAAPKVDLVVGSELVYTTETAIACANTIIALFQANPFLVVAIVQVTDRHGWNNIFLPHLQNNSIPKLAIHQEPLDHSIHDQAQSMIPRGGTLDQWDFQICFISAAAAAATTSP